MFGHPWSEVFCALHNIVVSGTGFSSANKIVQSEGVSRQAECGSSVQTVALVVFTDWNYLSFSALKPHGKGS